MLGVTTSAESTTPLTLVSTESPQSSPGSGVGTNSPHSPPLSLEGVITIATENSELEPTHRAQISKFFRKYFLEGQRLAEKHDQMEGEEPFSTSKQTVSSLDSPPPQYYSTSPSSYAPSVLNNTHFVQEKKKPLALSEKYRKYIAFLIPFGFMHLVWWTLAIRYNIFRYELAVTMILGATVAGMTSEGGGAIAFPVMTLMLKISPTVARDFSLMIQACGMTSAAFTIVWMKIKLEWHSIIVCSLGATAGIITGLEFVDHLLTGAQKKMLFVSIWFSFALSLFLLNTQKKRVTYESIQNFNWWKLLVLLITGFVGGLCSAFAGSGVDICSFSMITLLFRVSEKVATPTSVVLMAVNTCVGFFWRELIMRDISTLAWEYFQVSVPVVVICAPMGSLLGSHFHRLVLAAFIYVLEIAAVIGFLCTGPDPMLIVVGILIVFVSFIFFLGLSRIGKHLHEDGKKQNNGMVLSGKKQIHIGNNISEGRIKPIEEKIKESAIA